MTISTSASSTTIAGNGVTQVFQYSFVNNIAADIVVSYTNASGIITTLTASQYTLVLGNTFTDDGFAIGGTVTYPITGSPIASGTTLTISRVLPLTQLISISNQGNFYPQTIEQALDITEMQIQQVSNRTTQFRGTWTTTTYYSVGDIVQDGANGADTFNYYICLIANLSGVWATDLANGDWGLSVQASVPSTNLPITLSGAVTGTGTQSITTTLASEAANTVLANATAASAVPTAVALTASTLLGRGASGNIAAIPYSTFNSLSNFNAITGNLPTAMSGSSTTAAITVSSGLATDSTNAVVITGAGYSWAVSNGNTANGYAGGTTLPNSSTIHMYLCTGTSGTCVFANTSYPSPVAPTGYNSYNKRIFSFNTNSSGAPIPYSAKEINGGAILCSPTTQLLDLNNITLSTASRTLSVLASVPTGLNFGVTGRFSSPATTYVILTSPDETDVAPQAATDTTAAPGQDFYNNASWSNGGHATELITDTSARIGTRGNTANGFYWVTRNFTDFRRA